MKPGTSLIELLIAIGAISVVLITLVAASSQSISTGIFSRTQARATKLAEEQMERVRAYRDRNGLPLLLDCVAPVKCYLDSTLNKSYSPPIMENLTVWWEATVPGNCPPPPPPQPNPIQVTSYATWTDAKGDHQSKVVSCLSGWRG